MQIKEDKEYLSDLNEAQKAPVIQKEGPLIVVAGAGSGITRVLTYRIAYLMDQGVDPFSILALTFTNKAAREMKDRISKVVGQSEAMNLWMGTFHSVFARILRAESNKLGYPSNFTIYDTQDSERLISSIIKGSIPYIFCRSPFFSASGTLNLSLSFSLLNRSIIRIPFL